MSADGHSHASRHDWNCWGFGEVEEGEIRTKHDNNHTASYIGHAHGEEYARQTAPG